MPLAKIEVFLNGSRYLEQSTDESLGKFVLDKRNLTNALGQVEIKMPHLFELTSIAGEIGITKGLSPEVKRAKSLLTLVSQINYLAKVAEPERIKYYQGTRLPKGCALP